MEKKLHSISYALWSFRLEKIKVVLYCRKAKETMPLFTNRRSLLHDEEIIVAKLRGEALQIDVKRARIDLQRSRIELQRVELDLRRVHLEVERSQLEFDRATFIRNEQNHRTLESSYLSEDVPQPCHIAMIGPFLYTYYAMTTCRLKNVTGEICNYHNGAKIAAEALQQRKSLSLTYESAVETMHSLSLKSNFRSDLKCKQTLLSLLQMMTSTLPPSAFALFDASS